MLSPKMSLPSRARSTYLLLWLQLQDLIIHKTNFLLNGALDHLKMAKWWLNNLEFMFDQSGIQFFRRCILLFAELFQSFVIWQDNSQAKKMNSTTRKLKLITVKGSWILLLSNRLITLARFTMLKISLTFKETKSIFKLSQKSQLQCL
jgi:hypothetical protein